MEENVKFTVIGNIGDLSLSKRDMNSCEISFRRVSDFEYELFLTMLENCRIIFGKFSLAPSLFTAENDDTSPNCSKVSSIFKLHLWKTFLLPFNISHFSISNQCLWTLGENVLVDVSSYLRPLIQIKERDLQTEEDLMEIDSSDDFQLQEFKIPVESTSFQKYKLLTENLFLNCHLFDNSIIICSKDVTSMTWNLDLIIPSLDLAFGAEHFKILHLVKFPVTYNESISSGSSIAAGGQNNDPKPVITFIYNKEANGQTYNKLQMNFLKKLLGIFPSSASNCICLIGHPEGKLLYCLCGVNSKEQTIHFDTHPEIMYDLKQSIKGIHFLTELKDCKGNCSLLIIGKLGKLVFITVDKIFHNSNELKFRNESFYVSTVYLPSSIQTYALMRQTIIFISNNLELWVAEFLKEEMSVSPKKNEIKLSRSIIAMQGIVKMVMLNEQGLFLLVTRSGHLYLSKYLEQKTDLNLTVSLPSLMNTIIHQSSVLHNLSLLSKMHQDFFSNVSKFAALKFNGIQKLTVACSVTEIDEPPKKLVININIGSSERFDSRFWFATVHLYSFYQKDSIVISKTLPFETGQTITIEVQESLFCPPHSSTYPLYFEVGLLLTLPETFKSEDSFKLISEVLPLFIKIETLILNESYLIKLKPDNLQNIKQHDLQSSKNSLTEICSRNLKKPIVHLLHISRKISTDYPQEFSFCLFPNSSRQVAEKSLVESLSKDIVQLLKMRNNLADSAVLESLTCRNQQIYFHMSDNSDATYITLRSKSFFLLVGLRMAFMELLLFIQCKSNSYGSKCVRISANVNKECEKLSKEILSMYGQDVEREGFMEKIISMYCQLRKISRQLPFS